MSTSEIGCAKEDTGKEDMEEEKASDVNMRNEKTQVEVKDPSFSVPENNQDVDLKTENNDVKSLGLPSDNHGLLRNNKDMELESVDNDDKGHESDVASQDLVDSAAAKNHNNVSVAVNANELSGSKNDGSLGVESAAAKTDNNELVDANANEFCSKIGDGILVVESAAAKTDNSTSVDVIVNELSGSKNVGSTVHSLNQLECVAADKKSSERKIENDEKRVKLDDASAVDVNAVELSGSKNDGSQHSLNLLEGTAADERSSEIKAANDEKGEKFDDASLVEVSASKLSGSKNDGSHAHPLKAANKLSGSKIDGSHGHLLNQLERAAADEDSSDVKAEDDEKGEELNDVVADMEFSPESDFKESKPEVDVEDEVSMKSSNLSFLYEPPVAEGNESGTEEEQAAFVKEVENFYKERGLEFKHPKFYKEDLNLLKLWRAVIKLGGYEEVTSCKLWRQVGESFNPPKTCTTVSWTFRIFYEKALLEFEKHRMNNGEHPFRDVSLPEPSRIDTQAAGCQALGSGRARRDAAARAMQGWHSKRVLGSGEVCQPIIKEKNSSSTPKSDRQIKNIGMLKRKKPSSAERTIQVASTKATNPQSDTMVIDVGPPADWVKINVQRTSDCFEVYALVPGLLREEVHVQSDPAGRLVISGQPEQLDNPWGVTPFKKVVSLPSRIDPHQTSAVVTLHGQLFVRVPFEQSDL